MFCVPARGRSYSYRERRYGVFAYALRFPCEVDADNVQADHKYGVLWVALSRWNAPKPSGSRAKSMSKGAVKGGKDEQPETAQSR